MSKNTNLHKAKREANDEFYTQYEDIAKEGEHLIGVCWCSKDKAFIAQVRKTKESESG